MLGLPRVLGWVEGRPACPARDASLHLVCSLPSECTRAAARGSHPASQGRAPGPVACCTFGVQPPGSPVAGALPLFVGRFLSPPTQVPPLARPSSACVSNPKLESLPGFVGVSRAPRAAVQVGAALALRPVRTSRFPPRRFGAQNLGFWFLFIPVGGQFRVLPRWETQDG